MFDITDTDLLRLDPAIFHRADAAATRLLETADAQTSGSTLTSATADFASAGIDTGHVAVLEKSGVIEVLEVVARNDAQTLAVTRPRATADEPTIEPTADTNWTLRIVSFARLVEAARDDLFAAADLGENDSPTAVSVHAVLHPQPLARLLARWTIERAWTQAAAASPEDASLVAAAEAARSQLRGAWGRTVIVLDLDGDGVADATRRLSVSALRRS
jgi:hypothetical protein